MPSNNLNLARSGDRRLVRTKLRFAKLRPAELQNHELNEQLMLINQLDEDEKSALIKIINSMLTKKRMKDLLDGKVNF